MILVGVPDGIRTRVPAVKAGWLNVTLTHYRNTGALDGVLGAARNTLLCPRCVPGLLEILDFPSRFGLLKQWQSASFSVNNFIRQGGPFIVTNSVTSANVRLSVGVEIFRIEGQVSVP